MADGQPTYQELLQKLADVEKDGKLFKEIVDNTYVCQILRNESGQIIYVNSTFFGISGYQANELVSGALSEQAIVHPDDYEQYKKIIKLSQKKEIINGFNFRLIKKDGLETKVSLAINPISEGNKLIGTRAIIRNIAPSNDIANQNIHEVGKNNIDLINLLSNGVLIHSNGNVVFANETACRILKANSLVDLIGKPAIDFVHPDFNYIAKHRIKQCLAENRAANPLQVVYVGLDGNPVHVFSTDRALEYNGEPSILTVFTDISKIVATEIELVIAKENAEEKGKRLRERSKEMEDFFSCAIDLLCIANIEGYFLKLNKEWETVLGFTLEELLSKRFVDFVHPDDAQKTVEELQKHSQKEQVVNFTIRCVCKDNSLKWIEWKSYSHGNKVFAAARDITDKIKREHELDIAKKNTEESERQFRQLFENMEQGFVLYQMIYDGNNKPVDYLFVLVNNAFEKLFGLNHLEIIGKPIKTVMPNINNSLIEKYGQVAQTGKPLYFQDYSEEFDKYYDVIAYSPIKDFFAVIFTDVTLKKVYERKLVLAKNKAEESEQKLRVSEEKLRLKLDFILSPHVDLPELSLVDIIDVNQLQEIQHIFTEATGVASIIVDQSGKSITNQSNFNGVCNLIRSTEIGLGRCSMSDKTIGMQVAKQKKPIVSRCKGCGFIDAGAPIFIGNKLVAIWMIGQANLDYANANSIAEYAIEIGVDKDKMLDEYSKLTNMPIEQFQKITDLLWILARELSSLAYNNLLLAKKIEEQKEYEINLIKAKEQAEESGQLKAAFLQNISHEIRTPMNAIMGFSGMLNRAGMKEDKKRNFVKIIQNNCNQLLTIVSDILTISSVETNQEKVHVEAVCVNDIIVELYSIFKFQAFGQNLSIYSKKPLTDEESEIYVDRTKLTQILTNLITNALKFTHEGFVEFGYNLIEPKDTDYDANSQAFLQFYVMDSGIGIDPKLQEKIFERFRQADIAINKKYGGTGLGLSISKAFVELLKGKIWVKSEPPKGSVFYFTIPYLPVVEAVDKQAVMKSYNQSCQILIVEDEEYNFLFFEELLANYKLTLIHAKNGQEAVDICKSENNIGLILMDIKLPVMDGITATGIIKSICPDIPIIAQTAYALEHEKKQFDISGFDEYLTKPIDPDKFIEIIDKYIGISTDYEDIM